ncbi:MAG TPA: acyltransferase, partial [Puia sp.]
MPNNHHAYIYNLTPLRGFAALWVAAYHFRMSLPGFGRYEVTNILSKGYMMVDLFFIMSGFIILHVYGSDFSRQLPKNLLRKYFIARFARTYPLHFFTLALLIIMTCISGQWSIVNDPAAIPTNLLLLQSFGIHKVSTWNRVSWSLSAEWASYVAFPILSIFLHVSKKLGSVLTPFLILTVYVALLYWLPPAGFGNAQRLILHQL